MLDIEDLEFRKLDFQGVQTLVGWAKNEGWNPSSYDAEVFWKTDPDGFCGYFLNDVLIAGGSIVSYNGAFGFMGLFIVKPEYRNQGIGRKLWYHRRNMLLERLKPNATIGMDGVVAMQEFYKKGGFEILFKDERYENIGKEFVIDKNITSITTTDFEEILNYDKQCFGFSRPQFLKLWIEFPQRKTFKYSKNGNIKGFAVARKVDKGFKIGPLFANTTAIAEELYKACLNALPEEKVYLDIPMVNAGAIQIVKKYQATYVFECARMYYGNPPEVDMNKVFGITTFELG